MAHRGALRELFVGLSMMMLIKNVQKNVTPSVTSIIVDVQDDLFPAHNITAPPILDSTPTMGFLSSLMAIVMPKFSGIVEDVLTMAAMEVLAWYLIPTVLIMKRLLLLFVRLVHLYLRSFGDHEPCKRITQSLTEQISSLTKVSAIHTATISSLDRLLGESERRVANTTKNFNDKFAQLTGEKVSLHDSLRRIVDPDRLQANSKSTIALVQDLEGRYRKAAKDLKNANKEMDELKKAEDDGQLAQKEEQIKELNTAKSTLDRQLADLEKQLRNVVGEAERAREAAAKEDKKLRKRASEAEDKARDWRSPRDYDLLRNELEVVLVSLRSANKALEDEQEVSQGLRDNANAHLETERQLSTAEEDLKLANEKLESVEKSVSAQQEKAGEANKKLEAEKNALGKELNLALKAAKAAENKARSAEAESTEKATRASELQQKLDEAEDQVRGLQESNDLLNLQAQSVKAQPETTETASNDNLVTEISGLRKQVEEATQQASIAFGTGYQQALDNNPQPSADNQIREALRGAEASRAQEAERAEAELERVKEAGRGLELQLNNTMLELGAVGQDLGTVRQQLSDCRATNARQITDLVVARQQLVDCQATNVQQMTEIEQLRASIDPTSQEGDLQQARNVADHYRDRAEEQWHRAEAEKQRADLAEEDIKDYKGGRDAMNGRIQDYQHQIRTLKRKIPANAVMQEAEFDALMNSNFRACAIIEEFVNRNFNYQTRQVLISLMKANDAIIELKILLKDSKTMSSRDRFIKVLEGAEIDKEQYSVLTYHQRQVLVRQCRAVNAKLASLRLMINASQQPNKDEVLAEILKPRGDENAVWDDELSEPESESDEDDDGNGRDGGNGNSSGAVQNPFMPIPTNSNSDSDNRLKRKDSPNDNKSEGPGKRHSHSDIGLRPIAGPARQPPQQGSSSPEAELDQKETESKSQDDLPSLECIGEATAPQVQSNDQIPHSSQPSPLVPPPTPTQNNTTPAIWLAAQSQFNPCFNPKPTMIPAPTPNAHPTPSEQQENSATNHHQDKNAAPAQRSLPFTGEGSFGFSFSVPKNISSANIIQPVPAQPSHDRIFHGFSVLGAAMADKKSALPGLPPPEEDDVIDFGSSTMRYDHESDSDVDDRYPTRTVPDDDDDDETAWEDALYPKEPDDHLNLDLRAYRLTKKQEPEDDFHINLDSDD